MPLEEILLSFSRFSPEQLVAIPFSTIALWVFWFVIGLFVLFSFLYLFHWLRYGSSSLLFLIVAGVYFGVSTVLISFMYGTLAYI
jgi:hypothetical protein